MDPAVEAMNMAEKGPQKNEEIMLKTVLEVFVKMVVCRRTMTQQMRAGHLVPLTISETMEEEKPMTFPVHKSETIRSASLPSNVHLQLSQEPHHDRNIPVSMHPSHLHQTMDGETITSDFETAVCSLPRNVTSSCSERLLKSAAPNKDSQEANLQSAEIESTQMLSNVGSDVVSQGSSLCGATVTRTDGAITMADEEMKPERSERVKYAKECKGEGTLCAHISIPVEPVSVDANEDHYIDVEKDICTDKTPAHSDEVIYDKVKCIDCPHSVVSAFTPLSRKEVVGAYPGKERSTEVKLDMKDKIIQPISLQPSRDEDICHVFGCPLCKGWSSVGKCSQNVMKSKLSCPSCSRDLTVYLTGKRNVVETSKHSTYEEIHDTTAEISAEKTKHDSMDIMIDSNDEDNHSDEDVDRNEGVNDTHIDDGSCKIDTSILAKSGGHLQGNSKMMVKLWNTAKRGKGKQRASHSIKMEGKLKQQHQQQKFERKKITDFKCEICSKCFSNSANLKKHIINVHERKRSHCCEMCGKQFCYRSDLAEHMSVHTDERKHLCQVCGECFKTSRSLKLHVKRVHQMANVFPFQCKECDVGCDEGVDDTHKDGGSHETDTSILAKSGGHLQGNSKMMIKLWNTAKRGEDKQRASYSIKLEGKLKQQHRQQKFERKKITDFKCEICSKCFSNSANLKKHIIFIHEKKRNHCCEMCGKQFCYRSDLAEHMSVHTDERKHLCQVCGECFKTSRSLKLHVKRVHQMANVFPFQCKECGDYLKSKVSLQYHYKSFHSGPRARPYTKKRKVIS